MLLPPERPIAWCPSSGNSVYTIGRIHPLLKWSQRWAEKDRKRELWYGGLGPLETMEYGTQLPKSLSTDRELSSQRCLSTRQRIHTAELYPGLLRKQMYSSLLTMN